MLKRVINVIILFTLSCSVFALSYSAEVLSMKTDVLVKGKKVIKDHHYEIIIHNRRGEDYTKVTLTFSPIRELSKIEARLKTSSGKVIKKLKSSDIKERSYLSRSSFYDDVNVREFQLKHNIYPYVLEYSYQEVTRDFVSIAEWHPLFYYNIPTRKAELTVAVPQDFRISTHTHLMSDATVSVDGVMISYSWTADSIPAYVSEYYTPPIRSLLPLVRVTPMAFCFDINGSLESWEDYGDWQYRLNSTLQGLTSIEKAVIDRLVSGVADEKEKIKSLYHYLQDQTRYVNISTETGGLKPHSASTVCNTKYGDCKALTNYFKEILEYVGIQTYYSIVYAGESIDKVEEDHPSFQSNHIILYVPLASDTFWLDCTSDLAFAYLGTFTQNRKALVVEKDKSRLVHTPALSIDDVKVSRHIKVNYQQNSNSQAVFDCKIKGDIYESLKGVSQNYTLQEKERIVKKYFSNEGVQMMDFSIQEAHRDSSFINLTYTGRSTNIFKDYGDDMIIRNIPFPLTEIEDVDDRTLPLQLPCPIYFVDTIRYARPAFYALTELPDDVDLESKYGMFSIKVKATSTEIVFEKQLILYSGDYPLEEYADFYEFYSGVVDKDKRIKLLLNKKR